MIAKKKCILSIVIPTYNRGLNLESILSTLVALKKKFKTEIEIIFSNNNSTDKTSQILQKKKYLKYIKVFQNKKNIGATLNIRKSFFYSSGEWIVNIGDDDKIDYYKFQKLVFFLKNQKKKYWFKFSKKYGNRSEKYLGNHIKKLSKCGLDEFGFLPYHVVPKEALHNWNKIEKKNLYAWAHYFPFINYVFNNKQGFQFIDIEFVKKKGLGDQLVWSSINWLNLIVYRLKTAKYSFKEKRFFLMFLKNDILEIKFFKIVILSALSSVYPSFNNKNSDIVIELLNEIKKMNKNVMIYFYICFAKFIFNFRYFFSFISLVLVKMGFIKSLLYQDSMEFSNFNGFKRKL